MLQTERIVVLASILWAIGVMVAQVVVGRGRGRVDYSSQAGSVAQGIIYNFTWAMLPSHKETIKHHPIKFLIGILMHISIFATIAKVLVLLIAPNIPPFNSFAYGFIVGIGAVCGVYLFLRRVFSHDLHTMSSPDDYIAVVMTLTFIILGIAQDFSIISTGAFLIFSAILFFYMPVGKLKHAVFFFVARADYGARLGFRGTYPAKNGPRE